MRKSTLLLLIISSLFLYVCYQSVIEVGSMSIRHDAHDGCEFIMDTNGDGVAFYTHSEKCKNFN